MVAVLALFWWLRAAVYCCGDGCPYYQVGIHGMAAHDSGTALWITCHVHPEDGRRGYTLKIASVVGGALV